MVFGHSPPPDLILLFHFLHAIMSAVRKNSRNKFSVPSLDASIFRMINEDLYKAPTQVAAKKFKNEPGLFSIYHKGFADQVKQWSA